jgi:hypothetical protein
MPCHAMPCGPKYVPEVSAENNRYVRREESVSNPPNNRSLNSLVILRVATEVVTKPGTGFSGGQTSSYGCLV